MGILHRVIAAALAVAISGPALAACDPGRVDLRGDFGTVRFRVELALTPEEQARGLMFREEMARMAGMLFVYPRQQRLAFWMRNTLIPLDMIFLDETGTVINVHAEAVPLDETPILSEAPGLAVLEINGGMAATLGIGPGDELRSPAMPQDRAAWPCE
ncbi:DUF192 domain-containing protein [Jannaschia seohaensis]|uniref:DUF192 domain-containing protein n=1 Tax=Jannaschia seohaensis TaxID=475081 RepID=A0A2Y9ANC3_9RHOB|nr:DUF192 domain-containing protein [Jannaschia seohaensis]PWJ19208.1 hypothetical protein BCF38_104139 [Jannaschia seohaensis]SSA45870.1 hypothetical protein SAMN05421539_104139 [Jannaschia seohaensis]